MNLKVMNLNNIVAEQFKSDFKLTSPNTKSKHPWHLEHLHADFIELKALFWQQDEWLTLSDVIEDYKDNHEDLEDEESETDEVGSDVTDKNDKLLSKFISIFQLLKDRKIVFEDDYPFEIDTVNNYIKLPNTNFSEKQLLYLNLLISSNLNNFNKSVHSILTKDFEKIAAKAMEGYFPKAIIREFGKNTTYKGNTIKKINNLSTELNLYKREDEVNKLAITAAQEKGLDLLAYIPFTDSVSSMVIVLGQCACGKNWVDKTGETYNYETYLDFYKLNPIHSIFIPYSLLINSRLGFYQSEKLFNRLLFERKRILESIQDLSFFLQLNSYKIVQKSISVVAFEV